MLLSYFKFNDIYFNICMNQTILVTGAAGFIGFHLCKKLLENGFKVIGIDNINDYYDVSLKETRLGIIDNDSKKKLSNL